MKRLWARLDDLAIFHPGRWPHGETLSRAAALLIIAAFLAVRFWRFDQFPQTWPEAKSFYAAFRTAAGPVYSTLSTGVIWGVKLTVWSLETAIYLGYVLAYVSRARAVSTARGIMETAFPVVIAGLPVLMSLAPYSLPRHVPLASPRHVYYYVAIMGLIALGGALNLIGLLHLRRAFTIMAEARRLVTTGIFRHIRHPLYTGHLIMFFGSLLLRPHGYTLLLYGLFVLGQVHRARIEERKLAGVFPEYDAYRRRTGMFFPRCRKPADGAAAGPSGLSS